MKSPITSASMTIISTRLAGASRRLLGGAWLAHDLLGRQKHETGLLWPRFAFPAEGSG